MFWRRRAADSAPEAETEPRRHPRRVLLLSLVILVLLFVATSFAARFYHAKEASLAQLWFKRGNQQLQAGQAEAALEDFRNALSYSPDNQQFEFRLAQALVAADRLEEAESYLLALDDHFPGSGPINLELARLEAAEGRADLALNYYQRAVDGVWESNTPVQRRQTQLELCQFLLARRQVRQAQAELLALAADTPPDNVPLRMEVADLLSAAGDWRDALAQFRLVMNREPRNAAALAGAGQAAFETGDFRQARDYLELAVAQNSADSQSKQRLDLVKFILDNDPFQVGLTDRERASRLRLDFAQALYRLKQCAASLNETLAVPAPQTDLQTAYADALKLQSQIRARSFEGDPKAMTEAMDLILEIENLARAHCGQLPPEDEALRVIGQRSRQGRP
jgi:tetratricopeptide (TPR) repeat protein